MTYEKLAQLISKMGYEQLHSDVIVYSDKDFYEVIKENIFFTTEDDILGEGVPYLKISHYAIVGMED